MSRKVILDPLFRKLDEIFDPTDLERLHSFANVVWGRDDEPMPTEIFEREKQDAFAIVTGRWRHNPLEELPNLQAILEVGGRHPSPQTLDYNYCFANKIRILSCAPAFGPMVAEMALGMALAAARDIVDEHIAFTRSKENYLHTGNVGTFTLYGQTVGFIGFGGLARCLKPLLAPFGCTIQAYDPWLPDTFIQRNGAMPVDLETLLSTSSVIFVLAIPSLENEAMLTRELLSLIQPNSVFVLISRSHVVDFDALTDLVAAGRFKAAIDVFPKEPLPQTHAIRTIPKGTILSAHRAGTVRTDMRNIGRMVVDDLEAMLAGLPPTQMQVAQPEIVTRLS